MTGILLTEQGVVTETQLVFKEEVHAPLLPGSREHQQTLLPRRQGAEVERLPATGMPLTEVETPTRTEDNRR